MGPGRVVDSVRFQGQENGLSLGRLPDGGAHWYPLTPTRDAANAGNALGAVVSEIMYNPDNVSTTTEYVEIHNPTAAPVQFWNAAGSWR